MKCQESVYKPPNHPKISWSARGGGNNNTNTAENYRTLTKKPALAESFSAAC